MLKPKVLFIVWWYPTDRSPVDAVFVEDQAKALSDSFDVLVLHFSFVNYRMLMFNRSPMRVVRENRAGVNILRYPILLVPRMQTISLYRRATQKAFRHVVGFWGRPDIIHAHVTYPPGWIAMRLGKQNKIPVVLTEHSGPFSALFSSRAATHLIGETLTNVDSVVAVSPSLAAEMHERYPSLQIQVIGNIVPADFFAAAAAGSLDRRPADLSLFSAALLTRDKGFDYLIRAAKLLVERGINNFRILVGGDGPYRKTLEELVADLGIGSHFQFLGMLSRPQVRVQMQKCDVFILPSLHETFSMVVAEAMACGKPVIATRCGGPEYYVDKECGILVNTKDAAALAGAMADFIEGRIHFEPSRIRSRIDGRFGGAAFVKNISELYDPLLSSSIGGKLPESDARD